MKRLLSLVAFFATLQASAQQVNPVPDYVFRNQMSVGRNAVTDTGAYFSIGPRYGAVKGFMPPIVSDTASVNANKRNGLLIFSVQKNKFLYWDSVRVQWSDMAGSSGSYITGKGITGYVPQFSDTATLDTSALYTLGNQLGVGTSSFAYTGSGRTVVELNGTAGGLYGFKRNDSAKGYLFHNGDNMELANTMAGSISFNTNSATRGSIASDGVWRLHNLAGTGDRVVQASSNGTLSATASVTGLVDTLTISTRAWRQKGIDSVVSIIPAAGVGGSGTTNYVPKFTASSTIGNSQIFDNGTNVGIGTTSPSAKFTVVGAGAQTILNSGTTADARMEFHYNSGREGFISWDTDNLRLQADAGNYLTFFSNATERLRIFANGRIGINTTTDAGYQLDINGTLRSVNGANFATTSGNVGIGTTSPVGDGTALNIYGSSFATIKLQNSTSGATATDGTDILVASSDLLIKNRESGSIITYTANTERGRINAAGEWILNADGADAGDYKLQVSGNIYNTGSAVLAATSGNVGVGGVALDKFTVAADQNSTTTSRTRNNDAGSSAYAQMVINASGNSWGFRMGSSAANSNALDIVLDAVGTPSIKARMNTDGELLLNTTTDAGDYKLQVVGNARVGTGKLDIASNTTFGIGVARSGTSEVAGQIYNSNGILYLGAESSAGGQIFTGSSAYAAVIGSGANYPLQFATNNATRATINTNGELLINTTTDNGDFKLQVNGNALISGSIKTANGGSSTAVPWHLGSVVATSVQLDTNNYVEVEINGTFYRLAIVTPL